MHRGGGGGEVVGCGLLLAHGPTEHSLVQEWSARVERGEKEGAPQWNVRCRVSIEQEGGFSHPSGKLDVV